MLSFLFFGETKDHKKKTHAHLSSRIKSVLGAPSTTCVPPHAVGDRVGGRSPHVGQTGLKVDDNAKIDVDFPTSNPDGQFFFIHVRFTTQLFKPSNVNAHVASPTYRNTLAGSQR